MGQLLHNSSIWDLHIHSCLCSKSNNSFQQMDISDFVSSLLKIFDKYDDLTMISFTDHNSINYEVYKEFYSKNSRIVLIPGVELDCLIGRHQDKNSSKHVVFYFNVSEDSLKDFSDDFNKFVSSKNEVIPIADVLDYLLSKRIQFVISPHAFKQNKKGLDYDWNDENLSLSEPKKYADQFFCFWEASGASSIARAINFLDEFDVNDRVSIVAFSDSSDETKLKKYLDNPHQYFNCLSSFRGIQMAGTDIRRIVQTPYNINNEKAGNYIYRATLGSSKIEFSPKLNTIIGGRGSGKSLLLDLIAINLNNKIDSDKKFLLHKKRKDFLNKFSINIFNYYNDKFMSGKIKFDYFCQSYVSKLFNEENQNEAIKEYFEDEFNEIKDIDYEDIKLKTKQCYSKEISNGVSIYENISNLTETFININDNSLPFKFLKKDISTLNLIDFKNIDFLNKNLLNNKKIIPEEINGKDNLKKALYKFYEALNDEIYSYNKEQIIQNGSHYFVKEYIKYTSDKSKAARDKRIIESSLYNNIEFSSKEYVLRAEIIKGLIAISKNFQSFYVEELESNGFDQNKFKFTKECKIERPFEYFFRITKKHFDGNKIKNISFEKIVEMFLLKPESYIKDSSSYSDYIEDLKNLDLQYDYNNKINYSDNGDDFIDIINMSPGTQTNILMEYIVSKDTDIPLLIDQPEDNIDNETVYRSLTKWFNELKNKRQIIVVTHDANVVINSDAENIIISKKINNNDFEYRYGALEYGNNIDDASIILDGGKVAVERRLKKYGK